MNRTPRSPGRPDLLFMRPARALGDRPASGGCSGADEHGSADGMWTLDSVAGALNGFATGPREAGFACEEANALATETIGFGSAGG
jgi:hypothetical protein